jgi:hypothetical protein
MSATVRPPKPLRVAFDMDGVVADLAAALRRHSLTLFGGAGDGEHGLSARRRRQLWAHMRSVENFWESLDEAVEGGVARLAALAEERRWGVIFLTTRPETAGAPVQQQTQRWLIAHGFVYPSVFVVRKSRGAIAAALELDVVVDDRPENCLDVVSDSSARVILNWQRTADVPAIALDRLRIDVVKNFDEVLDRLSTIDAALHAPPPAPKPLSRLLHAFSV